MNLLYDVKRDGHLEVGEKLPLYKPLTASTRPLKPPKQAVAVKKSAVKPQTPRKSIPQKTEPPKKTEKPRSPYYELKLSVTKVCPCGNSFTAKRADAVFCSPRCRQAASRESRQLKLAM